MSLQKWQRAIVAADVPEDDPNTTAPNPAYVFEPVHATDVERGLWVALEGTAGDDVTLALYARAPGSATWFLVGGSATIDAGALMIDPFSGAPPDGFEFVMIPTGVTGSPTKLVAGLVSR